MAKNSTETPDECRTAFESRRIPNLDLKRNEDGSYRYEAAQMAFRDFADGWQSAKSRDQQGGYREAPFRRADHIEAMSEIMHICKRAMGKTVGEPWVALDKVNRIASRQMLLMKTPMEEELK